MGKPTLTEGLLILAALLLTILAVVYMFFVKIADMPIPT